MSLLKRRITQSDRSTIIGFYLMFLGLLICVFFGLLLWHGKATLEQVGAFLTVVIGLLVGAVFKFLQKDKNPNQPGL